MQMQGSTSRRFECGALCRTLNNNGTATWSGANGPLDMINGSVINNGATSVWNYTNDSDLVFGGGNPRCVQQRRDL